MVSKVQTLTPTDGIKDPQVRAFCESLTNVWQLRNGNTGFDDKERFITKQEWDFLAKNPNIRALAGVGQEGASINQPGEPGTGTAAVGAGGAFVIPPWIQNLVDFLNSGITLIDFDSFRKAQGSQWTTIYRLTSEIQGALAGVSLEILARTSSDNALATQLNKLWAQVGDADPTKALVEQKAGVITIKNVAATAVIFNAVQATVTDPSTHKLYQAASQQQFTAYVNADLAIANASYSLIVQAQAGNVKAIAGMSITANVVPGQPPQSATIFLSDVFQISTPGQTNPTLQPFIISGGKTRINLLYIGDYIQSDTYIPKQTGWIIKKDGSAEFNGVSFFGKVYSGSVLIDRDSGLPIPSVATGVFTGESAAGTAVITSPSAAFYGPLRHGSAPVNQRIRQGDSVPLMPFLVTTVLATGVVDHYLSIFRRFNGGGWQHLATSIEPGNDYGATSVAWSGPTSCAVDTLWEFGLACVNNLNQPFNPSKTEIRIFSLIVTMTNL